MSSQPPYKLLRWDAPFDPTAEKLGRILDRDGWTSFSEEIPSGTRTPEVVFPVDCVRVVISGAVQVSFPGYGSVELNPGDQINIVPNALHDLTILGHETTHMLFGFTGRD